jgi:hypothetical protein
MMNFSKVVMPDGTLNKANIVKEEEINKQKNVGRLSLTRFLIETSKGTESFIYKPATERKPIDFELWFQDHLLPKLGGVRSPKLLAHRIDEEEDIYWMIYEDIGSIQPSFSRYVRIKAAEKMGKWHSLSTDTVSGEFKSFMPYIDDALHQLIEGKKHYKEQLGQIGVVREDAAALYDQLIQLKGEFPTEKVVCHGDYHCLNLLDTNGDLVVIDWEYVQVNSIYWDFYTLLDMATPRYRIQIDKEIRTDVLSSYIQKRRESGWTPPADFYYVYHLYSLIYSTWILGLVADDLEADRFDEEILLIQKRELTAIINDCLDVILQRSL